MKTGINCII
jgi:hypothetical protein